MNKFFKSISWLILLNIIVKPVWLFLIDRQVQVITGHEAYGRYFALYNLTFVLSFLADAGMSNMMNQRIARRSGVNISQLLKIKFFLLLGYALICFGAAWLTGIEQWELFIYIVAVQAFTSLFVFLRNIVTAHQHFNADAFFSVLDKTLMIIFCSGFIYGVFTTISLLIFLQVQLISTLLALTVLSGFVIRKKLLSDGHVQRLSSIFSSVAPFAAIILLMSMHSRLDGFLLERLHPNGAYEAGVYASAFRLLDASNIIGYLVASFLVPFIARNWQNRELTEKAIITSRNILLFIAVTAVSFVLVFAQWIQQILYYSNIPYISLVIQLTLASLPAYYLVHVYGSALTATANLKLFVTVLIAVVVLNIILNVMLIPSWGAAGICVAALVSHYLCAFSLWIVATRQIGLAYAMRSFFYLLSAAIIFFLVFYWAKMYIENPWVVLLMVGVISVALLITQMDYFTKKFFSHA